MIKDLIISIVALLVTLAILFIAVYIFIEKDRERCMNMPFDEMIKDESCQVYMEALNE